MTKPKKKKKRGSVMWAVPWIGYGRKHGSDLHPLLLGSAWLLVPSRRTHHWEVNEDDIERMVRVRVILEKP